MENFKRIHLAILEHAKNANQKVSVCMQDDVFHGDKLLAEIKQDGATYLFRFQDSPVWIDLRKVKFLQI